MIMMSSYWERKFLGDGCDLISDGGDLPGDGVNHVDHLLDNLYVHQRQPTLHSTPRPCPWSPWRAPWSPRLSPYATPCTVDSVHHLGYLVGHLATPVQLSKDNNRMEITNQLAYCQGWVLEMRRTYELSVNVVWWTFSPKVRGERRL